MHDSKKKILMKEWMFISVLLVSYILHAASAAARRFAASISRARSALIRLYQNLNNRGDRDSVNVRPLVIAGAGFVNDTFHRTAD
jgi:hypothetical protein